MKKNIKKIKKTTSKKDKVVKVEEVKKVEGEEEVEKESSTLSDGVLDAFDEVAPVDPLLEDETLLEEEEDDLDSGDYRPNDDW